MSRAETLINQNAIAEKLNLSIATVSRALRNQSGIHPATRSKVIEVAAQMGYRPLRNRTPKQADASAGQIGVFIRSLHRGIRPFYLDGMLNLAGQLKISLVLHHTPLPLKEAELLMESEHQPAALRDGTLNGIILVHRWPAAVAQYLSERLPCVSIIHQVPGLLIDSVSMDHTKGMALLVRHLYDLGHRRIGFFGLNGEVTWSKSLYGGYAQALCELGLPMDPSIVISVSAQELEDRLTTWGDEIDQAAARISRDGVTAFVASSQWVASVLCRGLTARGVNIPKDVSVTGFDDMDPMGVEGIKITSTRVPGEAMGAEALRRVLARIVEPSLPAQTALFSCALIEGDSTAPPGGRSNGSAKQAKSGARARSAAVK
jgi:DNA-binding LacI/PurR family transcriptional regulator